MSKKIKIMVVALLFVVCLALSFGAGCALRTETRSDQGLDSTLDIVEEVWNIIYEEYVDLDRLDSQALSQGAIKGIVEALNDPYTAYLDVETYRQLLNSMKGTYEGIGAYVGVEDGKPMIIAPIEGSPADKAGIRAGDIILEIDGKPASEMSLEEVVLHIRGPEGTSVRLLILHKGETEPEEIEIVRAEIDLASVYFEMMEDIAYVRIAHFTERTDDELLPVLQSITQEAVTGIILDLRSNPGGLLSSVIDVASRFLKEGVVIYVVDNQGEKSSLSVGYKSPRTDLPVVVLVDEYSASGSEVLAGALQDHNRGVVAGTKTYGKGSVNVPYQLKDGSGFYITTARWYTPGMRVIEGEGIEPDYPLELEGEDAIQWAIEYLKGSK